MAVLESHVRLPNALKDFASWEHSMPFIMLSDLCADGDKAQPSVLAATAITAGFGSTEQQHMCSLLKCGNKLGVAHQTEAEQCRLVAASAAARLAQLYAAQAAASSTAAGAGSSCMSELLPWLVLFGRCCLQWVQQLQWRHKGIPGLHSSSKPNHSAATSWAECRSAAAVMCSLQQLAAEGAQ
jgi:hypothetical protein